MFKEKMNPHMDERMLWIRGVYVTSPPALTKTGGGLAMGLMILLVPIAHFTQQAVQKRRQAAEED